LIFGTLSKFDDKFKIRLKSNKNIGQLSLRPTCFVRCWLRKFSTKTNASHCCVFMATLSTFIALLTDRYVSTIQEERVVASPYQKWLPESATLIHSFYVYYVLFISAIWLMEINFEEAKEVCIFFTCTWIFLPFRSFMSCSKQTTITSRLHCAQVNFAICFLLPH